MEFFEFVRILKSRNLCPGTIQAAEWNNWTLVSCHSGANSKYISESVAMGIDKDPNIALAKALTEFLERKLSKESADEVVRLTKRSDGFAAFPVFDSVQNSMLMAAKNALGEAVERYLWAKWWDDELTPYLIKETNFPGYSLLKSEFNLKSVKSILVPAHDSYSLLVLLAETEGGGFVTGGAAGVLGDWIKTFGRAFGELLRHLIVVRNMKKSETSDLSFYEKRLWGFGSGEWRELVLSRLSKNSIGKTLLPKIWIDQPIRHPHMDIVSIHRCLFENQPLFIGGTLERLCI